MNSTLSTAKWENLKQFKIEASSGSDRLFRNGRQQVELRITLEAIDINLDPVPLSDQELASVRLVEYHGEKEIPQQGGKWNYGVKRDTQYRFYPLGRSRSASDYAEAFAAPPATEQLINYRQFYITTTADSPLRVAVKITRDDGEVFFSSPGNDGSVTLTPIEVPAYRAEDYTFKPIPMYEGSIDCIPFVLNSGGTNIEFRQFSVSPASVVKGKWTGNIIYGLTHSGYTEPGQSGIHYGEGIFHLVKDLESEFIKVGQPVVVRMHYGWPVPKSVAPRPEGWARIEAVDMYGNSHALSLRFKSTELADLELELY
ncbi:hypothetical protein NLO88_12290 [Pseudomonas syringae]|nr:hypothetical protein [Pseudomonas syringae]MCQ3031438.1 hypothetical protein [Pseudomonas syringae]MDG6399553.1 hypothetical protein [Pseudomonas quasicaspiana]